jgi:type I restriction enzyme S subunit
LNNTWPSIRLANACLKIGSGATPRGGSESYLESGQFSLIRSQNVYNNQFTKEGLAFISKQQADDLNNVEVVAGDVLLNITGDSVARCCQAPKSVLPARVNQHVAIIRPDPKDLDPTFLRYFLVSPQMQERMLTLAGAGGTRNALTKGMIENFDVPKPDITVQRAIASVLSSLDEKIELNRWMNTTLEELVRGLFKSWFVDFDPVHTNDACFQDSAIGPIPKGWRVERFDKHITADRGLSYKGEGLRDDGTGVPMHNLNSVYEGGGYKHEGIKYYAGEYRKRHLLQPGDMIVTNTEQGFDRLLIGHAAIVPKRYGPKGLFSHHLYRVGQKPGSPFSPHYLVELFNNRRWHYWISGFSNGTTINMLPRDALEMPLMVVPPEELVKNFTVIAEAIHTQVEANLEQSSTLSALRDALLPKLLSGELRFE